MNEKSDEAIPDNSILQFARSRRPAELPDVTIAAEDDPGLAFTPPSQSDAYFAQKGKGRVIQSRASAPSARRSAVSAGAIVPIDAAPEHRRLTLRLTEPFLSHVEALSLQYREIPTKTIYRLVREALEARKLL